MLLIALAVTSSLVGAGSAQTRTDFSGRWIAAQDGPAGPPASPPPTAGFGGGLGSDVTIIQTEATLTIERAQFSQYDIQPKMTFVYALDGSERRNLVNMGRGPQETTSRATWQDGALQLTTTYRFLDPASGQPATSELQQVFALERTDTLVVSATRSGMAGAPATTSRQTFTRK
jgi:hypothetical protein